MQNLTPLPTDDSSLDTYSLDDWRKGYRSLPQEYDYWIEAVEGTIPADLNGTLFRNGPGLLEIGGHSVHHPFDGDGMVCAIAFQNGRAHFRNRYVKTKPYLEEQKAGKPLYRGVFGTQKPGGLFANLFDVRLKNIANTNILPWGNKLWALWEAAQPHQLDPATLETIGLDDLNGVLAGGKAFSAHPRIDPACDMDNGEPCLVNFSIDPGLSTKITIYELNLSGKVVRQHSHAVPGFAFIHDFAITPNYCIFFQSQTSFNPLPFLFGKRGAAQCLNVDTQAPTKVILIPRHQPAEVKFLSVDAGFVFHHANAFEQDQVVYVDSVCYGKLPELGPDDDFRNVRFNALDPGQLWRFKFDLASGTVDRQLVESRCCEFPVVHPQHVGRPYRYTYLGAADDPSKNAPLQGLVKVDLETGDRQFWSIAPRGFAGEPIFVPRGSSPVEDQGWLLLLSFNAELERSQLVILDAQQFERGAIATLTLKHHVPYGLHGNFTPTVWGI
jgi:all-trans-8'-apo-beta-carotenal 15,15'-oxygenase